MEVTGYSGLKKKGVQSKFPLDKMSSRCVQAMDRYYTDSFEAVRLLEGYADEGEWGAYLALAQIKDYTSDYNKAVKYMKVAYKLNPDNKDVKKWLGATCYRAFEYDEAEPILLDMANQGDAECQALLGDLYSAENKHELAFGWYTKASEKNNAYACQQLGYAYKHGWGVPANKEKSEYYFKRAYQLEPSSKEIQKDYKENVPGALTFKDIVIAIFVIAIIIYIWLFV